MATINATIAINSGDLTSNPISINNTMTMLKAGTCHGLEKTSGLVRRSFTSTNHVDLVAAGAQNYGTPTASDVTTGAASKIYIKNTGTSSTDYVIIGLGNASDGSSITASNVNGAHVNIGRLYGGDWMLIPAHMKTTVGDITIKPSTAEVTTVEYMLFFE